MPVRRSILLHGLLLTLRRPGALLWTYAFNLGVALVFAIRFATQLNSFLSHSLATQSMTGAFDLGAAAGAIIRLGDNSPSAGGSNYLSVPIYALIYFLLVPGTLFCYQTGSPAKLSTLLGTGLLHFWRFVRVTLLSAIVFVILLGPLIALQHLWANHVDLHFTGYPALAQEGLGVVLLALVAGLLRLYFDLVTAYTIQIGLQMRPNGRSDRRVRRTLLPALRVLRHNFLRSFGTFMLLTALGSTALFFGLRASLHTLAQPRVWPLFLLAQLGLFLNLFARFWQRGAETILSLDYPILPAPIPVPFIPPTALYAEPAGPMVEDPIPDPEPASPSLPGPDRGIYEEPSTEP